MQLKESATRTTACTHDRRELVASLPPEPGSCGACAREKFTGNAERRGVTTSAISPTMRVFVSSFGDVLDACVCVPPHPHPCATSVMPSAPTRGAEQVAELVPARKSRSASTLEAGEQHEFFRHAHFHGVWVLRPRRNLLHNAHKIFISIAPKVGRAAPQLQLVGDQVL